MYKFVLLLTFVALASVKADSELSCLGCVKTLEGDGLKDAEKQLNLSLTKLASGNGPNYKLGKINTASSQVVSGIRYIINADLIEGGKTKTCDILIHSEPWKENGIKVTFKCPEEPELTKTHSA